MSHLDLRVLLRVPGWRRAGLLKAEPGAGAGPAAARSGAALI